MSSVGPSYFIIKLNRGVNNSVIYKNNNKEKYNTTSAIHDRIFQDIK